MASWAEAVVCIRVIHVTGFNSKHKFELWGRPCGGNDSPFGKQNASIHCLCPTVGLYGHCLLVPSHKSQWKVSNRFWTAAEPHSLEQRHSLHSDHPAFTGAIIDKSSIKCDILIWPFLMYTHWWPLIHLQLPHSWIVSPWAPWHCLHSHFQFYGNLTPHQGCWGNWPG